MEVKRMERQYTVEDIYHLPEGVRAELIDGDLYSMAAPGTRHQEVTGELFGIIREYIKKNKGECKVFAAPFAVFLKQDNQNYVEPDISVICDKNKITEKGCNGAPDWIIEVVSPGSEKMDYMRKLLKYQTAGVREYWIVDPKKDRVIVYNFEQDDMAEYTMKDSVTAGIYGDLEISFEDI